MKRGCKKYKWDGDVRVLFDSLDVASGRNKQGLDAGDSIIEPHELTFLDTWKAEPTQEEVKAQINAMEAGRRMSTSDKGLATVTEQKDLEDSTQQRSAWPEIATGTRPHSRLDPAQAN